jgi:hypothetical protein
MIELEYNDGGRSLAGFKGTTGDCVVRAFAIASMEPYKDVYGLANEIAMATPRRTIKRSSARLGVQNDDTRRLAERLGFLWHPTMSIGSGCQVHLRADELPPGRIVVKLSRHVAAVIDGVLHDTYDCSREGTRCVYGYWSQA